MNKILKAKFSALLKVFKTKELKIAVINEEVELVRQKMYEKRAEAQCKDSSFFKK